MKIRCERTSFTGLTTRTQAVFGYGTDKGLAEDLLGRSFLVVAIGFWEESLWYYILLNEELLPVPAALFSVTDGHLPDGWMTCSALHHGEFDWYACPSQLMAPTFNVFYSDLVEGRPGAHRLLSEFIEQRSRHGVL